MTIFVAGIHGVGKSFLCRHYAAQRKVVHATASALIKQELAEETWTHGKRVKDIAENQAALIRAVEKHWISKKRLLLDGHFVLRNNEGKLEPIDTFIFHALKIQGVALVQAPDHVVQSRLRERGEYSSLKDINDFLVEERAHAEVVCTELAVPLVILDDPNKSIFFSQIDYLFGLED